MKKRKLFVGFMIVFTVMLSSFAFYFWQVVYTPNILVEKQDQPFLIPPGSDFKYVQNTLYDQGYVTDLVSFSFLSKLKKYHKNVKPGYYTLTADMSNTAAINLLRSGAQTPVTLTFNNARKLEHLAGKMAATMAFDSLQMKETLTQTGKAAKYGFDSLNFISMFIPNSYEVYWTESPDQILDRMKKEYDRFWNAERKQKATEIGLDPNEVSTLASIVQGEVSKQEEAPIIAGLYLNRIKSSIPLQADPTLVFAANDFTIRRVLNIHKEIDSPYNTYKNLGLPPGPISQPTIQNIDAVLNYKDHKYLYMCAKADFSGYHAFATNLIDHNKNARALHRALNRERIYR
ncbi:MAG: endolytic transglycosylase MltG [Cyclobacteriaceae bacterium]